MRWMAKPACTSTNSPTAASGSSTGVVPASRPSTRSEAADRCATLLVRGLIVGSLRLALAAAGLARARYEQIRFAEAVAIAEEALAVVGDGVPEAVPLRLARLLRVETVVGTAGIDRHGAAAMVTVAAAEEIQRAGRDWT